MSIFLAIFFILFVLLLLPTFIALYFYFSRKNSELEAYIANFSKKHNDQNIEFSIELEVVNKGNFHAILLDANFFIIPVLKITQKKIISLNKDYYFDTVILKKNKIHKIILSFSVDKDHQDFTKGFILSLILKYYDLKPIRFFYKEFVLGDYTNYDDIHILPKDEVFCLKTPIITHYNSLEYLSNIIINGLSKLKNDYLKDNCKTVLVCIAESLVSIIQNRAKAVYSINPGSLALLFNHYFNEDSSLSSPYSLDLVIREIGFLKFYFSLFMGIIGKVLGFRGWFYFFAGRKAAAVDDAGGTVRPYDKFVVLAPSNGNEFSTSLKNIIKSKISLNIDVEVFVVDANDLGKVDILGYSSKDYFSFVKNKLKSNPQGNDDEQTPIVFIPIY